MSGVWSAFRRVLSGRPLVEAILHGSVETAIGTEYQTAHRKPILQNKFERGGDRVEDRQSPGGSHPEDSARNAGAISPEGGGPAIIRPVEVAVGAYDQARCGRRSVGAAESMEDGERARRCNPKDHAIAGVVGTTRVPHAAAGGSPIKVAVGAL